MKPSGVLRYSLQFSAHKRKKKLVEKRQHRIVDARICTKSFSFDFIVEKLLLEAATDINLQVDGNIVFVQINVGDAGVAIRLVGLFDVIKLLLAFQGQS